MKYSRIKYIYLILCLFILIKVNAQECNYTIRVLNYPQKEEIPNGVIDMLNTRLSTAVSNSGIVISNQYSQLFITAKFNHVTEDIIPGPPKQFAVHTILTLLIGNSEGKEIYSSKSFDLRGIGSSNQRALINSLQKINAKNNEFNDFINEGNKKVIDYYNANYAQILDKANKALILKKYDEALYYACSIPECCSGYSKAVEDIIKIFNKYIEYDGEILYKKAYAAWSANSTQEGANIAFNFLSLINSTSNIFSQAQLLADEIKKTIRSDYVFENKDKYSDSVSLKKAYIEAARQIGIAYGSNQKETSTNLTWIK